MCEASWQKKLNVFLTLDFLIKIKYSCIFFNKTRACRWAGSICELDIMYQLEQVHFLLDEMVQNGYIVETNKANILRPIDLMEREAQKADAMYK